MKYEERGAIIEELRSLVGKLMAEVADLKLQLANAEKDPPNSSISPSSELKQQKKEERAQRLNVSAMKSQSRPHQCRSEKRRKSAAALDFLGQGETRYSDKAASPAGETVTAGKSGSLNHHRPSCCGWPTTVSSRLTH